jgi:hypothetical protein
MAEQETARIRGIQYFADYMQWDPHQYHVCDLGDHKCDTCPREEHGDSHWVANLA